MAAATPIQIVSFFLMVFLMSMERLERVTSQGHMSNPPMRSSMWRYNFSTPTNYDDNQLWCGSQEVNLKKKTWHNFPFTLIHFNQNLILFQFD